MKLIPVDFNRVTQAGLLRVMPAALPDVTTEGEEIRVYEYSDPSVHFLAKVVGPNAESGTLIEVDWDSQTTSAPAITHIFNVPVRTTQNNGLVSSNSFYKNIYTSKDFVEA